MRGLVNSKNVMMESAAFLVLKNKNDYVYNSEAPILSMVSGETLCLSERLHGDFFAASL